MFGLRGLQRGGRDVQIPFLTNNSISSLYRISEVGWTLMLAMLTRLPNGCVAHAMQVDGVFSRVEEFQTGIERSGNIRFQKTP